MKKMVLSLVACLALVGCAFLAFEKYHDVLAAVLFVCSFIPSCLFEEARKERKGE